MKTRNLILASLAGASLALGTAAAAKAVGTPQRSSTPPPGLLSVLSREVRGIAVALVRTEGSNSRLQDLPASP